MFASHGVELENIKLIRQVNRDRTRRALNWYDTSKVDSLIN